MTAARDFRRAADFARVAEAGMGGVLAREHVATRPSTYINGPGKNPRDFPMAGNQQSDCPEMAYWSAIRTDPLPAEI
jgi:hypothetical protein